MYILRGGPRSGQLVDELPAGYHDAGSGQDPVDLFDVYSAGVATWSFPRSVDTADVARSSGNSRG